MITVNVEDNVEFEKVSLKAAALLESKKYVDFLAKKLKTELDTITRQKISGISDNDVGQYASENKMEVHRDFIRLFNYSMVDESKWSETTKRNYPDGLSLALLVEYGTGIVGENSDARRFAGEDNWEYDVNKHGTDGWYYGKGYKRWTQGMEGKLIYHTLEKAFKEKAQAWTEEFLKEHKIELGGK